MDLALVVVRAVQYAASIVVLGELAFMLLIAPAARRSFSVPLVVGSIVAALATAGVWLAIEARHMSGFGWRDAFTLDVFHALLLHTVFGRVWLVRMAAFVALAGLVPSLLREPRSDARVWTAFVLAAVALAGLAATGHAAVGGARLAADGFHCIAAAFWVGALPAFARAMNAFLRDPGVTTRTDARETAHRFSIMGMASVGTLVLSGLVNASYSLPTVASLYESGYGRLLMAKLVLFIAMFALAVVNRVRHAGRLSPEGSDTVAASVYALRRNALAEFALGIGIGAIVAQLGVTMPPMPAAGLHVH